jgi:hypothetical protein
MMRWDGREGEGYSGVRISDSKDAEVERVRIEDDAVR